MAPLDTPKLSLPLRLHGSSFAAVEQHSDEEIMQCVEVVLRYPTELREDLPEFGIPDQAFSENGADVEEIVQAIREWEPRADIDVIYEGSRLEELIDHILIEQRGHSG